ncbi:MAG: HrcA family transcriptional regulator [Anaerovorax sp.]|nr:HrcA family transcriptional regulator [Anaerovorax sp.]
MNLLPVDESTVILMIVAEDGKVSNTALKIKVPYTEENLVLLSKVMTHNYKGRALSDILTLDIIKSLETDLKALSKLAESIMPNFLMTLENMLNVDLYLEGLTNIFSIPEYNDIEKAKVFLQMLNQKQHFTEVLVNRDNGVVITIGDENRDAIMNDCSLITADYRINGKLVGKLGVIGPTRMKYDEVTSVIKYMTENISRAFQLEGGEDEDEE